MVVLVVVVVVVVLVVVVVVVVVVVGSGVVVVVLVVVVVGATQGTSITWQGSSPVMPGGTQPHSLAQVLLWNCQMSNSLHLRRQVPSQLPVVVVLVVVDP